MALVGDVRWLCDGMDRKALDSREFCPSGDRWPIRVDCPMISCKVPDRLAARTGPDDGKVRGRPMPKFHRSASRDGVGSPGLATGCTHRAMFIALPGVDSYGPLPMTQGTRPGIVWWALCTARRTVTVIVCPTLLSARSRAGGGATAGTVRIRTARSRSGVDAGRSGSSTTEHLASVGPAISAWVAAQRAFDDGARMTDADAPELAAAMVAPRLQWAQAQLGPMRGEGDEPGGRVRLGSPELRHGPPNWRSSSPACTTARLSFRRLRVDRWPVLPAHSEYKLVASTSEQANSGWKLETQAVGVGACGGS